MTPLAQVRSARGIHKSDVAKAVGCEKSHYGRIESGEQTPSAMLARKIARYFGNAVTEHQVLYPEDYMELAKP